MTEKDPLKKLFLDKDEINREKLAEALENLIGIDKETGEPYFLGGFSKLSNKQKIVAYLLYRKAVVALDKLHKNNEGAKSKAMAENIGVKYSSVRSWLSKLGFVEKKKECGGYIVPSYNLEQAIEVVKGE